MAYIRCGTQKTEVPKKENDLYNIWQPYGGSSWTAPRDGTVKVCVFVAGYDNSTNFRTATCTCMGITVTHQSYSGDSSAQNAYCENKWGTLTVKKGTTYTATTTKQGSSIQRYGAFLSYID